MEDEEEKCRRMLDVGRQMGVSAYILVHEGEGGGVVCIGFSTTLSGSNFLTTLHEVVILPFV